MRSEAVIECLANPRKAQLLLAIYAKQQATAKQLLEQFPDVPSATLYRYLKQMLDAGVLQIEDERPVRGAVEKLYALGVDLTADAQTMIDTNDGQAYLGLFTQFMIGIMNEFRAYSTRLQIDILHDGSGFSATPVYATTNELVAFGRQVADAMASLYSNAPSDGRKLHNICIITTPPNE